MLFNTSWTAVRVVWKGVVHQRVQRRQPPQGVAGIDEHDGLAEVQFPTKRLESAIAEILFGPLHRY
jgi:hypothetical protein